MATALPTAANWTAADTTEGEFKAAQGDLRAYLSGLLGTDGEKATALAALGAVLNTVSSKSADYTALVTDRGKLIDYTTAGVMLTLPLAASAGAGFVLAIKNSAASGTLTIGRNSASIDGVAADITLGVSESFLIVCDGTGWKTVGKIVAESDGEYRSTQIFTTSGTYTKPPGLKRVEVEVIACGGGGGGGVSDAAGGAGGGEGGRAKKRIEAAAIGVETVTVSATGGTAGAAGGGNGGTGSAASFGTHLSASGGAGGTGGAVGGYVAGNGGVGASGDINFTGSAGNAYSTPVGGNGGGTGGRGGYGAAGGVGGAYGGGGGGGPGSSSIPGGTGGPGIVTVREYF